MMGSEEEVSSVGRGASSLQYAVDRVLVWYERIRTHTRPVTQERVCVSERCTEELHFVHLLQHIVRDAGEDRHELREA